MTNNIKNKNQYDDAIEYEPKLDNIFYLYSGPNRDPLTVVTLRLGGGKTHRATIVASLTCIRYSVFTNSMIKRQKINPKRARYVPKKCGTVISQGCIVHCTASRCHFV